jgi:hypothetical protein
MVFHGEKGGGGCERLMGVWTFGGMGEDMSSNKYVSCTQLGLIAECK